ncbi:hypothetical protein [Escherichia coli]|uniref:hypothetical protein n=1 Tax=Escherichia coli TaxID=562 RepID=UPI0007750158|nr:hypothetical protein [Escherichia coli]EEW3262244.1 hypothetical protein [Escherichia coli]EFJ2067194.1 hypothetical protein [Escherichia coli]EFK5480745.1 hypothetical protein [Escherichia coli]KXP43459.1 hypothetical protein AUQ30_20890 [Escherichia coli]MBF2832431.1 hypothetical protein [Escherichia coli]
MNEQAQKILTDLLQRAANGVDAAVSFSQSQIPDVVRQLLIWNFAASVIFSILGVLLFAGAQFGAWKVFKHLRKRWRDDELWEHPEIIIIAVVYIVTFAPLGWLSLDWLKIWLAPKLYLIEYAASLMK